MKTKLINKGMVKKSTVAGYGVFATSDLQPGEIIEECYAFFSKTEDEAFQDYYFAAEEKSVLLLGYGCIYNHADIPNAHYFFEMDAKIMVFKACCTIKKGEEILVSYGPDWFSTRKRLALQPPFMYKLWHYVKGMPLRGIITVLGVYGMGIILNRLLAF